jgi:uncharacterized protein YcfJ
MQIRTAWISSTAALAAGIFATGMTAAVHADNFTEFAPVISSTPIIQRVTEPREECWTETITTDEVRRLGGISLGSFDTSTNVVVPVRRDVQRCRTVQTATDTIQGYDVRYRYHGREYVTRTATDPGDRIPVDVSVMPGTR